MGRTGKTPESDESGASCVPVGLIGLGDMLWGFSGETLTKSFIIDGTYPDSASWRCFMDSKSTDRARIEMTSTTELKFKIDKATVADSGLYSFCCKESKSTTNVAVRIIDRPKWSQPTVKTEKSGEVYVEWKPPTDPGAITGYEVECREKEESRWTKVTPYKVTECRFHDEDVVANKVFCYRVIAHNKIGLPWVSEPSKDFPYKVVEVTETPKIHLLRSYFQVNSGEPLSLDIDITGEYETITWTKYSKNSPKTEVKSALGKTTYKIHKATTNDAGKYEIVASNNTGSDTACIYVDVSEPPAPRMHFPSMKSVLVGESLELCVDIQGDFNNVTWEKDGKRLSKENFVNGNKTYRKEQTTLDDSGEYLITATNGDKSSEVKLKVEVLEKQWKKIFWDKEFLALLVAFVVCVFGFILHVHLRVNLIAERQQQQQQQQQQKQLALPMSSDINLTEVKIGIENFNNELKNDWNKIKDKSINGQTGTPPQQPQDRINKELSQGLSMVEQSVKLLSESVEKLKSDVANLQTNVADLKDDINKAFDKIDKLEDTVKDLKKITEGKVAYLNESIEKLDGIVSNNHKIITDELDKYKNFSKDLENKLAEANEATEGLKALLEDSQEVIALLRSNAFHRESLLVAFGIMVISGCVVVIWVYQINRNVKCLMLKDDPNASMSSVEVLERIPRSVTLERSVVVIGFSNSMSSLHRKLMGTALQGMNVNMTFRVISQHNQLLGLPRCQLYIMCVEFTERHVIIEEQGLGLGDLKRSTYNAIRKMGADLVIIYTRDPGSRSLPPSLLFNDKIYCVSIQPELIVLKDEGRFLSIYDKLSTFQRDALVHTVNTCLH